MRHARRYNPATIPIALPPVPARLFPKVVNRILDDERHWMTDNTFHALAQDYVNRHGDKYPIEREEQVSILFLKMCAMVASGVYDCERARFSTLCWGTAFPRTLWRASQLKTRQGVQHRDEAAELAIADRTGFPDTMEGQELRDRLMLLPDSHREILQMAFGVGYPELKIREIAVLHRRTQAWVRKRIDEGLKMLRVAYSVESEGEDEE